MHRHPGTAIPKAAIGTQVWAFDAVYTPLETQFLRDAAQAGLAVLSGYELFFYQGVDAFELFAGVQVDEGALRAALSQARPHL
jgi:shikimate dehydrogenase